MRRREIIAFAGLLAVLPMVAVSQTISRLKRIGFLGNWGEGDVEGTKRLDTFRQSLKELGWTEGKNLQVDVRFGGNDRERIR
jgi:putative ABC transport system substrate-binding protein